jgi:DNA-binding transcriptional MerR regulator
VAHAAHAARRHVGHRTAASRGGGARVAGRCALLHTVALHVPGCPDGSSGGSDLARGAIARVNGRDSSPVSFPRLDVPQRVQSSGMGDVLHIGDVARLLDLSLKTIRHWDEIGLAVPSGRSRGGFRLYTRADVARLAFIKRFRPVGFGLEETRRVIAALDGLAEPTRAGTSELVSELERFVTQAEDRVVTMRADLADAEALVAELRHDIARHLDSAVAGSLVSEPHDSGRH